jgi:hypothetical protein
MPKKGSPPKGEKGKGSPPKAGEGDAESGSPTKSGKKKVRKSLRKAAEYQPTAEVLPRVAARLREVAARLREVAARPRPVAELHKSVGESLPWAAEHRVPLPALGPPRQCPLRTALHGPLPLPPPEAEGLSSSLLERAGASHLQASAEASNSQVWGEDSHSRLVVDGEPCYLIVSWVLWLPRLQSQFPQLSRQRQFLLLPSLFLQ